MKISVIIPCYNAARTLGEQLEALAGQEVSFPWEVIVADNGSTDDTIQVAETYRSCVPVLRIVDASARRGAAHARNRGAAAAKSELLAFCDADDVVGQGYLAAVCEALAEHPFIACRYEFKRLNRRWISRLPVSHQQTDVDSGMIGPYVYGGGGSLAVRKPIHEAIGGFDEDNFPILQDTDYCIRMQRAGYRLQFAPRAIVHYRWRTTAREAFQQARTWGRDLVALRIKYAPEAHGGVARRFMLRHLLALRRVRSSEDLAFWIWYAGWQWGMIEAWRKHQEEQVNRSAIRLDAPGSAARRIWRRAVRKGKTLRDQAWRAWLGRALGRIDPTSKIEYKVKVDGSSNIAIGARVEIAAAGWLCAVTEYRNVVFDSLIQIEDDVRIGRRCHVVASRRIEIGRNVVVGDDVYISDNVHDYRDVNRSIAENRLVSRGEIRIGEGSEIGDNVCIIGNVRIGEFCRVAKNAVVTRDLEPYSDAGGIPARIIGRRVQMR